MNFIENVIENFPAQKPKTLEDLRQHDSKLREKLAEVFPDDGKFFEQIRSAIKHLEQAGSQHTDGEDRARQLDVARKIIKEILENTGRGAVSREFCLIEKARDSVEEEASRFNKSLRS